MLARYVVYMSIFFPVDSEWLRFQVHTNYALPDPRDHTYGKIVSPQF
jgi:hypothetical protein